MELKKLFALTAVASAIALTGCGSDDDNNGGGSDVITIAPNVNDANGCAVYGEVSATFKDGDCIYDTSFAGQDVELTSSITLPALPNGGVHAFEGALLIGKDCDTTIEGCEIDKNGPTLTVEAGATLAFKSGEAIVRIGRGAKIEAQGTATAPITFTSWSAFDRLIPETVSGGASAADWGGIIINGFGITNQCTDAERAEETCNVETEGLTSYYGGDDNADSSGFIEYAKIFYAGSGPKAGSGDDLNSLTLNAVGSGSHFDFIHIHQGWDDGIEFFGGASNISHIVVTDTQDDAIDIDGGWQGNGQFIFVKHGSVGTGDDQIWMGNAGFETDGVKSGEATDQAPASSPTIANVTVITTNEKSARDNKTSVAFKFDDAIETAYYNTLIVKAGTNSGSCLNFSSDGQKSVDEISFTTSVMACDNEFEAVVGENAAGDDVKGNDVFASGASMSDWFDATTSERVGGSATVLVNTADDNFSTDTTSTDISVVSATDVENLNGDDFFQEATYVGAVSADSDSVWYDWVKEAVAIADAD